MTPRRTRSSSAAASSAAATWCWRWCSAASCVLFYAITIVEDGLTRWPALAARAAATAASALIALRWRAGDARPRLRRGAALPPVLPGDRLRRHHPARDRGAGGRRGRSAGAPDHLDPLRRQRRRATCRGVPPAPGDRHGADRRSATWRSSTRATTLDRADHRHRHASTSSPSRPASISTRSSASASPSRRCSRARKCACR